MVEGTKAQDFSSHGQSEFCEFAHNQKREAREREIRSENRSEQTKNRQKRKETTGSGVLSHWKSQNRETLQQHNPEDYSVKKEKKQTNCILTKRRLEKSFNKEENNKMGKHIALILVTPSPSTLTQENGQRKVITWMETKKIRYKEVDAVDEKDVRAELTKISGVTGNYPQVFITDQENETTFVGTFEEIEKLVDLDDVDPELIKNNPDLKTFSMVFECCKE